MAVYLSVHASNGYYAEHTNGTGVLTVNGVDYPFSGHYRVNGSSQVIHSVGVWVPHNPDGSKTLYASASFNTRVVGTLTASNSATLTTIPRASSPTTSKEIVTFGESFDIYTHRKSTAFTHDVYVGVNNDINSLTKIADKIPTDTTWTLPVDWKNKFPDSSVKLLVRVYTFNGNTNLGRIDAPLVAIEPSSDMLPSATIEDKDETECYKKYGGYVKHQSKIKIAVKPEYRYRATKKDERLKINGELPSVDESSLTPQKDKITIEATITDSRDSTITVTKELQIIDWHAPVLTGVKVERCKANGESDAAGNYVNIKYNATVASVNSKNGKTIEYEITRQGSYDGTQEADELERYKMSGSKVLPCHGDYSWEIKVTLRDDFETTEYTMLVGTAFTLVDYNQSGRGMAIGKVAEQPDLFEIDIPTKFNKDFSGKGIAYDLTPTELQAVKLLTNTESGDVRLGKVLQTLGLRVPIKVEKNGQFDIVKFSDGTCEASCQIKQITPVNMVQWNACWWRWIGNLSMPDNLFKSISNVQISGHCNGGTYTCGSGTNTKVLQVVLLMPTPAWAANQVPAELPFIRVYGRYK
jgi:hypothetical protein